MAESKRYAVGQVVMHGKDQVVLLRPQDGLFVMSVLNFPTQVASPAAFKEGMPAARPDAEELKLTKELIDASCAPTLELSKYEDVYTAKLSKLIEAKVAGQELVSPPTTPPQQAEIINLMDALRKSVAATTQAEPAPEKPSRKMAASTRSKPREGRKKKSS
jgi:DNA end-binding protein Ku